MYGEAEVLVDIAEGKDRTLELRDGEKTETYYRSPNLPFVLEELRVSEYVQSPSEDGKPQKNGRAILARAHLDRRTVSVIGAPKSKAAVIDARLTGREGDFKKTNDDPGSVLGTLMLSDPVGAAFLGFIAGDWEVEMSDTWYLELHIPAESFDSFAAQIIDARIKRIVGSAALAELFSKEHWMAPEIGRRDLFLRPTKNDARDARTAMGGIRTLSAIVGGVEPQEPRDVDDEQFEQTPEAPPAQASFTVPGSELRTAITELRTTLKWICAFLVLALLYSARH